MMERPYWATAPVWPSQVQASQVQASQVQASQAQARPPTGMTGRPCRGLTVRQSRSRWSGKKCNHGIGSDRRQVSLGAKVTHEKAPGPGSWSFPGPGSWSFPGPGSWSFPGPDVPGRMNPYPGGPHHTVFHTHSLSQLMSTKAGRSCLNERRAVYSRLPLPNQQPLRNDKDKFNSVLIKYICQRNFPSRAEQRGQKAAPITAQTQHINLKHPMVIFQNLSKFVFN